MPSPSTQERREEGGSPGTQARGGGSCGKKRGPNLHVSITFRVPSVLEKPVLGLAAGTRAANELRHCSPPHPGVRPRFTRVLREKVHEVNQVLPGSKFFLSRG